MYQNMPLKTVMLAIALLLVSQCLLSFGFSGLDEEISISADTRYSNSNLRLRDAAPCIIVGTRYRLKRCKGRRKRSNLKSYQVFVVLFSVQIFSD